MGSLRPPLPLLPCGAPAVRRSAHTRLFSGPSPGNHFCSRGLKRVSQHGWASPLHPATWTSETPPKLRTEGPGGFFPAVPHLRAQHHRPPAHASQSLPPPHPFTQSVTRFYPVCFQGHPNGHLHGRRLTEAISIPPWGGGELASGQTALGAPRPTTPTLTALWFWFAFLSPPTHKGTCTWGGVQLSV